MISRCGNMCWRLWVFSWWKHPWSGTWAPSQYPKRRLIVRSREVSKPRDWYFKLSNRFEIWQAHRQQCCRSACQISERSDNSKYKSRGFETSRDLTIRRLFGYWDGALIPTSPPWRNARRPAWTMKLALRWIGSGFMCLQSRIFTNNEMLDIVRAHMGAIPTTSMAIRYLWPLLLTWFNFNLSMDK